MVKVRVRVRVRVRVTYNHSTNPSPNPSPNPNPDKVAPASTNQSISDIMTRNGYERRRWDHEDDGARPLTPHNQLWVRKGPWEPATYKWRPWSRDGGVGEGIGTKGGA